MPRAPGHTLVIPKAPARNILAVAPDDLAHVMKVVQKVARAGMTVFGADGVTVQQFSEPAGRQVVLHLHVHVMPRRTGVALKPPASFKEDPAVLSDQASKLAAALAEGGVQLQRHARACRAPPRPSSHLPPHNTSIAPST